jgi:uncharacterized protein YqgV (UPF0045/DUF77 family)
MAPMIISFQVLPGGLTSQEETYRAVDAAIDVIAQSGLPYKVAPTETTVEGEYDQVMTLIKQAQEAVIEAGAARLFTFIKVDYNPQGSTIGERLANYPDA